MCLMCISGAGGGRGLKTSVVCGEPVSGVCKWRIHVLYREDVEHDVNVLFKHSEEADWLQNTF